MNKQSKGKILETIVAMIEKSLADDPNVIIKPNHQIIDVDGNKREIDIYIETTRSKRVFKIAIECKNYKSNIKLEQLDAFILKCRKLRIDKPIFVTTSRFQEGAKKRAKKENVDLIELNTEKTTGEQITKEFNTKEIKTFIKKYEFKAIKLREENSEKHLDIGTLKLYNKDENEIKIEDIKANIIKQNRNIIYSYLNTQRGVLLNYKKIIFPVFQAENVFLKREGELIPIGEVVCWIEIWYDYKEVNFNKINRYQELLGDKILSSFISYETVMNGITYSFSLVKNLDEEVQHYMMDKTDPNSIIKLETLFTLPAGSIKFEKKVLDTQRLVIQPFEFNVTDDVVSSTEKSTSTNPDHSISKRINKKNLSKSLVGIDPINKKMFFSLLIKKGERMYTASKFPNPINLYFAQSLNQYTESERLKENFPIRVISSVENEAIDILADETYHKYFQNKIGSVIMLKMSLEAFLNFYLPNLEEKPKYLLEQELSFLEKLETICKSEDNKFDLNKKDKRIKAIFEKLNVLSNKLTNLPTETIESSFPPPYIEIFEELENFDLLDAIKNAKQFMNSVKPNFIQIASNNLKSN